ncbi:hypothetical protein MASR1M32_07390 [Rhodobacter sp.]
MTTPPTLWHATAAAIPPFAPLRAETEADLLVIGGGFTGLSAALHAAGAGLRVVLVEAEAIAHGATGRNAGFVVPNFAKVDPEGVLARLGAIRGQRLLDMAAGSADLVFDLIRRHSIACDAVQAGWIQPSHSDAALARAGERVRQWRALGRPVALLDADEVLAMTGVKGWRGGWIDRSGGLRTPSALPADWPLRRRRRVPRSMRARPLPALSRRGRAGGPARRAGSSARAAFFWRPTPMQGRSGPDLPAASFRCAFSRLRPSRCHNRCASAFCRAVRAAATAAATCSPSASMPITG